MRIKEGVVFNLLAQLVFGLCLAAPFLPGWGGAQAQDELVFLDPGVSDAVALERASAGAELVRLDPWRDPLVQMAEALEGRQGVTRLHVITHGAPGQLMFAAGNVDLDVLSRSDAALARLSNALPDNADVRLYACNLAQGDEGAAFTNAFADALGVNLAASTTLTGAADAGGDWVLEWSQGELAMSTVHQALFRSGYRALLAPIGAPVTIDFTGLADNPTGVRVRTYSSFVFTYSTPNDLAEWIELDNSGEGNSAAIAAQFLDATPSAGQIRIAHTVAGTTFDLNSFWYKNAFAEYQIASIEGFRGGVSQGVQAGGPFTSTTGATINLGANFNNVDEVVLTSDGDGFSVTLDSFNFGIPADTTAPRITSIVRQTPAAAVTNADSLTFRVTFDEGVQNVTGDDFAASGVTGESLGVVAQSATVYDVTVSGGDTASFSGAVGLSLAGGQNITDLAALPNALTNTTPTGANESYTVDNTAPAAPSTPDLAAGSDTGASSSDDITNDTTPTFTGTSEANATINVSSNVDGAIGSATADGSGNWSVTAGSALTEGTHTITATATDSAGNVSSASSGLSITLDTTAPDINSITRLTPTGQTIGTSTANVGFRVTYSEAVAGSNQADYAFQNVSGTAAGSVSSYGTSSATQINVQLGTLSGDGDFSISLNGGHGITDTAGNALSSTTPTGVREVFTRDGTAPSTTSFVRDTPAGALTSADTLVFTANYSETVSGVDTSDFVVSGTSATVQSVSAASGTSIDITVSGGDLASYNGTVGLNYAASPSIADAAGNALPNTEPSTDETYTLDNTAPSGYSVTLDQDPVNSGNEGAASFTFAGAEVSAAYNYTISSSGGGTNVTGSGTISGATDQITGIDVSGLGDGTLTLSVTLTDGAGNAGSAATDTTTKESQPPQVNSIAVSGSPAGNATSVDFTVTFSEAAQNISTDDFSLTTTGSASGSIASVSSATGTTVTVTVNTISGDGTIRLDLDAATNIQDASGNTGPDAYTSGATHTVDNTAPPAFNVAFVDSQIIQANETSTDIRFTTAEVGTTYAYSISSSGGGSPVTGTAAISTSTQNVTVNVSSLGDGTLTLTATLTDDAGNVTNQSSPDTIVKETDVPAFSVAFSPSSVLTGGTSTMTFTIDNSAVSLTATALDFTNNLPAGLTVATTPNASTTCTGGTLTATGGAGSITYTGGSVTTGTSCTVSADVTPSSAGSLANTSGALTSSVGNSGTASATLTATQPSLTVDDPSVTEGDTGTANLTFTVTLAPASSQTVTVDYATSNGSATVGSDYTAATGTLTFNPSVTTQTVSIVVSGDAVIEPDETVVLTLSNPSNATIGDATGTGAITTDDVQPADTTAPTLEMVNRSTPADERTNADSLTWLLDFSEAVVDLDAADFAVTGSTAGVTGVSGSGELYQVTVSGGDLADYDGVVGLQLSNPTIEDLGGNDLEGGLPSGAETYLLDNTGPVATLSSDLTGDVTDPFTVRVAFDEAVTGLELSDFSLTNASVSALQTAGENEFTVLVTPGSSGTLSVGLAAATVTDALGNENLESETLTYETDSTAPILSSIQRDVDPVTSRDSVSWTVTFSEDVTGATSSAFSLYGGTSAMVSVSGSGKSYQVTASGGTLANHNGVIELVIADPGAIQDASGNAYEGGAPSGANQSEILMDNTAPVATLSTDADANAATFNVSVLFSEEVTGFTLDDVEVKNATTDVLVAISSREYTIAVTPQRNGDLTLKVKSGAVQDVAGLSNAESNTLTLQIDTIHPSLSSIQRDVDPVTSRDSVSWTVTFSEDVTGVSSSVFGLSGGSGATVSVSGSGARYEVTASGGSLADYEGVITLSISDAGAIKDAAGNAYEGGAPTGANEADIRIDNTSPVVTLSTQADTVGATFDVTVTFSEAVDGFSSADVEITNASIGAPVAVSAREFTLSVTPQSNGSVTLKVKADAVQDAAGLTNAQSNTLTVETDTIAPVIENIVAGTELVTKADALSWTVEFSETVTGVDASDFTLEGASGVSFSVTGSEASYEVTASGGDLADLDGEVQLQLVLPSDIVDVWDNAFAGEGPTNTDESRIELDNSGPTPTLSTPEEEVVGAFTLTIAFDEDVSDLSASALTVENGAATGLTRVDSQTYTVSIQPECVGEITMTVAEGAVQDGLGNPSSEATLSVQAVSEVQEVAVSIDLSESNPVSQIVTLPLTNPGRARLPFQSRVSIGWLEPVVSDGVIPSMGSFDFQVRVTEKALELDPGVYQGDVTVFTTVSGSSSASRSGMSAPMATEEIVIAIIPVTLTVTTQNGTVQLVTTTPSGISGDVDVSFSSNVDVFNDVALTTVSGLAQTSVEDLESGRVDVTQNLPAGWRVESISCTGDLDGGSQANVETGSIQIDLDPNENLVCTFENVRDEDLVQLATQRAIRNFMLRRADRLIDSAPDLSTRLSAREGMGAGEYSANMDDGRYTMSLTASLAGARNQAKARHSDAPGMPSHMRDNVGRLDVWLSAELSGVTDNRAGERAESDFGVAQLGVDWAVSDDLLVGGMVQLDWMDETAREVFAEAGAIAGARVDGEGWMAGPYMVWRVADGVILDSMALYGMSSNTVNPLGLYEDEFDTDRWMLQANLTGEYGRGAFVVRPQATLTHFEETQDGYTDSLGIVIPSQSIALGRLAAGPELIWRQDSASGARWELRSKLRAVWDYQPADLLSETGTFMNSEADVRADGEIGIAATLQNGAVFELSVGMSGIGQDDFEANTARFQLRYPLSLGH